MDGRTQVTIQKDGNKDGISFFRQEVSDMKPFVVYFIIINIKSDKNCCYNVILKNAVFAFTLALVMTP